MFNPRYNAPPVPCIGVLQQFLGRYTSKGDLLSPFKIPIAFLFSEVNVRDFLLLVCVDLMMNVYVVAVLS